MSDNIPPRNDKRDRLKGIRVLVAEDDLLIGLYLRRLLQRFGCVVFGPTSTLTRARRLLVREKPDVILMDLRLRDGDVGDEVQEIAACKLPIVLLTGYPLVKVPDALAHHPLLAKPFNDGELRDCLADALQAAA